MGWVHWGAELVLQDLPGPSIARHASLGCPLVGAHLKADHTLAFFELFISEVPLVFLGFPAHSHRDLYIRDLLVTFFVLFFLQRFGVNVSYS